MSPTVEMATATHRGLVRPHNEDSIVAQPQSRLAVLADGMGGHNAGEVASRMAVEAISSGIQSVLGEKPDSRFDASRAESLIAQHIAQANALIYEAGGAHGRYAGMGTTIVVGFWYGAKVSVGHVGDSRMYRLRSGKLQQLTHDHSLVQEELDRGALTAEEARNASNRNIVTRAVGTERDVVADLSTYRAEPDDVYLLCSDGLTDMLTEDEIGDTLAVFGAKIHRAARELVQQANDHGGIDNVSVILVRVVRAAEEHRL